MSSRLPHAATVIHEMDDVGLATRGSDTSVTYGAMKEDDRGVDSLDDFMKSTDEPLPQVAIAGVGMGEALPGPDAGAAPMAAFLYGRHGRSAAFQDGKKAPRGRSPPDRNSVRGPSRVRLLSPPVWSSLVCSPAQDAGAKQQDGHATWQDRSTTRQDTQTTCQEAGERAQEAAELDRDRGQSVANRLRVDPLSLSNL